MPSTYEPIATTTLGSASSSVTFSSITGTYTDLVLVCNAIATTADAVSIRLNGDTGSNYSRLILWGNGSAAGSAKYSNESFAYTGFYANLDTNPTINIFQINNYSNTTTYKTILGRGNAAAQAAMANVNLWRNTAAITSIQLTISGGSSYQTGSTFTLYGIKAA
jgi:hypothetical protein